MNDADRRRAAAPARRADVLDGGGRLGLRAPRGRARARQARPAHRLISAALGGASPAARALAGERAAVVGRAGGLRTRSGAASSTSRATQQRDARDEREHDPVARAARRPGRRRRGRRRRRRSTAPGGVIRTSRSSPPAAPISAAIEVVARRPRQLDRLGRDGDLRRLGAPIQIVSSRLPAVLGEHDDVLVAGAADVGDLPTGTRSDMANCSFQTGARRSRSEWRALCSRALTAPGGTFRWAAASAWVRPAR